MTCLAALLRPTLDRVIPGKAQLRRALDEFWCRWTEKPFECPKLRVPLVTERLKALHTRTLQSVDNDRLSGA